MKESLYNFLNRKMRGFLDTHFKKIELSHVGRLMLLSLLIGVPTGLVAGGFNWVISHSSWLFLEVLGQYVAPQPGGEGRELLLGEPLEVRRWVLFFLPAVGGLLSGWLVFRFAPEAEGHGTDQVIDSFHRHRGKMRARVPWIKTITSAITIGTGGAAGREGPVAQVGAGLASNLADLLKLSDRERRILLLAGAGAGVGCIFRAPLGGALFSTEVLYRDSEFEFEALMPSFMASIIAYSVYCPLSGHGWGAIFSTGALTFENPLLLIFYLVLALLVFGAGRLYIEVFYSMRNRFFRKLNMPLYLKPAFGGLLLGVLALIFSWLTEPSQMGAVYGAGYGYVQQVIDGKLTLYFMLLLIFFKIIATSLTICSGGSGGVFGPSIVIGGLTGGAFGMICHLMFPELVTTETASALALVGMAGFWAGVANVPLASLLMISEMTLGYALLVPLMMVTTLCFSLSRHGRSIYEKQVNARIDSPAHTGDFVTDVLKGIHVSDVLRQEAVEVVHEDTLLGHLLRQISDSHQSFYPVLDDEEHLTGLISLDTLRSVFSEPELGMLLIAKDVAETGFEKIYDNETLNIALRRFVQANCEELPVVSASDPRKVVGMLNRRDLLIAYSRQMQGRVLSID